MEEADEVVEAIDIGRVEAPAGDVPPPSDSADPTILNPTKAQWAWAKYRRTQKMLDFMRRLTKNDPELEDWEKFVSFKDQLIIYCGQLKKELKKINSYTMDKLDFEYLKDPSKNVGVVLLSQPLLESAEPYFPGIYSVLPYQVQARKNPPRVAIEEWIDLMKYKQSEDASQRYPDLFGNIINWVDDEINEPDELQEMNATVRRWTT